MRERQTMPIFFQRVGLFSFLPVLVLVFFVGLGHCPAEIEPDLPKIIISDSLCYRPKEIFLPTKDRIYLRLIAPERNKDKEQLEKVSLELSAALTLDREEIDLVETGPDTGIFQNPQGINLHPRSKRSGDGALQVSAVGDVIRVTYTYGGKKRTIASVNSTKAVVKFILSLEGIQIAGKPFYLEVLAQDSQGNRVLNYNGTVNLQAVPILPKKNKSEISPRQISFFNHGKADIFVTYPEAGKIKIEARDLQNGIIGMSKQIEFLPAKFKLNVQNPQIVGKEFETEIIALNYSDEVTFGYERTAFIKLEGTPDLLKEEIRFKQGRAKVRLLSNQWGEKKIIACDKNYPQDLCGVSESVFFTPYRFAIEFASPPKNRKRFYQDEVFKGKIQVLDYGERKIPGYTGSIKFKPVDEVDLPSEYYFNKFNRGEVEFQISGISKIPFRIEVYDAIFPQIKGKSAFLTLLPAKIEIEPLTIEDNRLNLWIKIVDSEGRLIREDDSTLFTVHLTEGIPNQSAFVLDSSKVKAKNGKAQVTILNTEKERVTVIVDTKYFLESEPLEVTF